ncbi:MAG: hypothetical protein J6B32_08070 [Spirochaetaceae bacterium]|nr:hypothetical protein [Spirochaetaceae bacterium]
MIASIILALICLQSSFSYFVTFKEQYYKLFHTHYQQYPDDVMENIYWLEKAVEADFCNPQYALAKIQDEKEWEKYRYLFMMHINLKLIEQHMRLGRTWDKQVAYFYDAPWKEEYLRDLEKAESCYQAGLYYWEEAKLWAEKASAGSFQFLYLTEIQNWEDECYRISVGNLDYEKILNREIKRVQEVKDTFIAMNEETY